MLCYRQERIRSPTVLLWSRTVARAVPLAYRRGRSLRYGSTPILSPEPGSQMSGTYRTRHQQGGGGDGDAVEPAELAIRAGELARYTVYILHKQWFGMGETGPGGYL